MRFYINGSDVYTKEELQHRIEILLNRNQTSMSPLCKRLYNEKKHIKWYQMRQEDPATFVQLVHPPAGRPESDQRYRLRDLHDDDRKRAGGQCGDPAASDPVQGKRR